MCSSCSQHWKASLLLPLSSRLALCLFSELLGTGQCCRPVIELGSCSAISLSQLWFQEGIITRALLLSPAELREAVAGAVGTSRAHVCPCHIPQLLPLCCARECSGVSGSLVGVVLGRGSSQPVHIQGWLFLGVFLSSPSVSLGRTKAQPITEQLQSRLHQPLLLPGVQVLPRGVCSFQPKVSQSWWCLGSRENIGLAHGVWN